MKAKDLVGMWIASDILTDELNAPLGTAFKVVGHVQNTYLLIVDARRWGLDRVKPGRHCIRAGRKPIGTPTWMKLQ